MPNGSGVVGGGGRFVRPPVTPLLLLAPVQLQGPIIAPLGGAPEGVKDPFSRHRRDFGEAQEPAGWSAARRAVAASSRASPACGRAASIPKKAWIIPS